MFENETYGVARYATRSAWKLLGRPRWSSEDWEDLIQVAALEVWRVTPLADDKNNPNAFIFFSARRAALKSYIRELMAHNPASTLVLDWTEIEIEETDGSGRSLNQETIDALVEIFRSGKKQRVGRAVEACRRDARIVDLLVRGYRNDGIAQELAIPVNSVKQYRKNIRARLTEESLRRAIMTPNTPVSRSQPIDPDQTTHKAYPRRPTENAANI